VINRQTPVHFCNRTSNFRTQAQLLEPVELIRGELIIGVSKGTAQRAFAGLAQNCLANDSGTQLGYWSLARFSVLIALIAE